MRLFTGVVGAASALALLAGACSVAWANGYTEDVPWQFQTSADKANKGALVDLMERKKHGFFNAPVFNTTNTTNIGKQINCSVTATAAGNSASNGQSATNSSPTVTNGATANATTTGNSAINGIGNDPNFPLIGVNNTTSSPLGSIDNTQGNDGSTLSSGVTGPITSTTGTVSGSGGSNSQVLNNDQNNSGDQAANISDSTACAISASP